jgi:hypothetical protein
MAYLNIAVARGFGCVGVLLQMMSARLKPLTLACDSGAAV